MKVDRHTPEKAILEELGRRLEQIRKQQGLAQAKLAERAGLGVATLRRIEDGQDAQLGSWIKALRGLGMVQGVEGLLPENYRSPMADVRAERGNKKGKRRADQGAIWGDERP